MVHSDRLRPRRSFTPPVADQYSPVARAFQPERWCTEVDTAADHVEPEWHDAAATVTVSARSVIVLRNPREVLTPAAGAAGAARA